MITWFICSLIALVLSGVGFLYGIDRHRADQYGTILVIIFCIFVWGSSALSMLIQGMYYLIFR